MLTFDGKKNPSLRANVEGYLGKEADRPDLAGPFFAYRKKTITYACKILVDFEVDTLEGVHKGKAGDYLAVGIYGEMYPIDAQVFEESYLPIPAEPSASEG